MGAISMGLDDHEGGTGAGVAKTSEGVGNWAQSLWATRRQESHGFLFETDFELRFRYVSPAVGEICGFEPEERTADFRGSEIQSKTIPGIKTKESGWRISWLSPVRERRYFVSA
jgi:hypothetical protein